MSGIPLQITDQDGCQQPWKTTSADDRFYVPVKSLTLLLCPPGAVLMWDDVLEDEGVNLDSSVAPDGILCSNLHSREFICVSFLKTLGENAHGCRGGGGQPHGETTPLNL